MARIRTVKPEFWEDETIGTLSRDARLLFIATFNMADDEGLLRWTVAYVKAQAFLYDEDLGAQRVSELMNDLVTAGLVHPYRGGKAQQQLGMVVNFHRHQRVNRPQPSKLPAPSLQQNETKLLYARRDGFVCHLCGYPTAEVYGAKFPDLEPSPDHLTPKSAGGSDHPSNIRNSHLSCNKGRGDRPIESFTIPQSVARALGLNEEQIQSVSHAGNDSVNGSVNESQVASVPSSPPEGNGREGEWKGNGSGSAEIVVANEDPPYSMPRGSRGTRIPQPFIIDEAMADWARERNMSQDFIAAHTERFVNYWLAAPSSKGVKANWRTTWMNWLLKASDENPRAAQRLEPVGRLERSLQRVTDREQTA